MMTEVIDTSAALPKGWKWVLLGDLVNKKSKKIMPSEYPEAKFIGMDCIEPHSLRPSFLYKFSEFKSAGNFFKVDQVLYGRMRPYLNKVYKAEFDGACSGEFIILECKENFTPDLLSYILHSKHFVRFANNKTNGDRPRITFEEIIDYPVALPPKSIQPAIVSKIEELFTELDKGIESLKLTQQQIKVYRQSVLKWAFEGRLTNEDVKEGELPEGWKTVQIGDICKSIVPNRDKPKSFTGNIKWITTPNLREDSIHLEDKNVVLGLTKEEVELYNARVIPPDSVIMTCVGNFGLSAVVSKPIVINQQLHAFVPNDSVYPKYLAYCIQSNKQYFESKSTSTTIQYLNKENCNSMPFSFCPIPVQISVVQEIENRLSVADKMEENINQSLLHSEALRQSILKRAFEGKL